ncbi:MAG: alanine dehydrogenase [Chloroflexi bacterium]|nr:alanine dehydrogenase [Chloroflexota bacterium]
MIVGVTAEVKESEYRVGMVPAGVHALRLAGHQVLVQAGAGMGTGIKDEDYQEAGASILTDAVEIFRQSEMIVKVKEPQPSEWPLLRPGQIVFTYFHFAADPDLTRAMVEGQITCVAYETIQAPDGSLPLLTPMSEVAGRMAVHEGAKYLERPMLGKGILLAGVPGVAPANVVVIGGGLVGSNAAKMAAGLGANVVILDVDLNRLRHLDDIMPANVITLMSNPYNIRDAVARADLLIGAVLIRGARAPRLVTEEMVRSMRQGAVIVDVAIDQGGCIATCRPTTHQEPTYVVDGVVHYCVTNMPGAVPGTSTYALTNATQPYVVRLAGGFPKAAIEDPAIRSGVNIARGKIVLPEIAGVAGFPLSPIVEVLGQP